MPDSSYNHIFRVNQTVTDISKNFYCDRIRLLHDISNGYFVYGPPPTINPIIDISYMQFQQDFTIQKSYVLDLSNTNIDNINFIHFGDDICRYIRIVFDREITLENVQFKNDIVGDVSFTLWKRFPLPENVYSRTLSEKMPYGAIPSVDASVNKISIYNVYNNKSYDYIFELKPPQKIPKNIVFDTHATNDIFYIDASNIDEWTKVNSDNTSFIMWYKDNDTSGSLYIDPSNIKIGYLSIEEFNSKLTDLSGDYLDISSANQLFSNNPIKINNTYPNFQITFDTSNSDISLNLNSKLLKYLGINNNIELLNSNPTQTENFTYDPSNIITYITSSITNEELHTYLAPYHGDSIPNNNIVYNLVKSINIYEKRPITDGNYNDISNNGPKSFDLKIKDKIIKPLIQYGDNSIFSRAYDGIIIDVSYIDASNIESNSISTFSFISDLSLISAPFIDVSNDITCKDLSFNNNSFLFINKFDISNAIIENTIDCSFINSEKIDVSSIIVNYLDLSSSTLNVNTPDISGVSCINFVDTHYRYLRFDFNNTSDISINNLKIYDGSRVDISFITWESSGSNISYDISNALTNSLTKTFTGSNVSLLFEFTNQTRVTSYSYDRIEKIFTIDASNNIIKYVINDPLDTSIDWNKYILEIGIPYGNWTIAEINAFLAETDTSFASVSGALGKKQSVSVKAYEISGNIINYDNSLNDASINGLKPRNTHFNKYIPFTALYLNSQPVIGTAFDYQIHDISGYAQPKNIYTFYNGSSFFENFFDASYLVPYETNTSTNDISGIIPQNFSNYIWKIKNDYNTSYNFGTNTLYNILGNQTRLDDISNGTYQNVLLSLKYDSINIYGIYNKTNIPDSSFDDIISTNVLYDYYTFKKDHYKNTLDISYHLLYPDLSSNDPSYNINTLCIPLLDTSINSTINEDNKDIFIQNNLLTETNKKIHLDVIKPIVKYRDISNNILNNLISLYYDSSGLNFLIESNIIFNSLIYIYPSSTIHENFTSELGAVINHLSVDGVITGILYNLSDDRLKHNEEDISGALNLINSLNPKIYYKTKTLYDASHTLDPSNLPVRTIVESGYIAQEVANIPELNFLVDTSSVPMKINYIGMQAYLTKAIQELNAKVLEREELIQQLQTRVNLLKNS